MKRYLLFGGACFYASGGWNDFKGGFDSIDDALNAAESDRGWRGNEWWHIVDTETGSIVSQSEETPLS